MIQYEKIQNLFVRYNDEGYLVGTGSVSVHYGMLDESDPNVFCAENRILLTPYQSIPWEDDA